MKKELATILCCPLCKQKLKLIIESQSEEDVHTGSLICSICERKYRIRDGIPFLCIPDAEIVKLSNNTQFSQFQITPDYIDKESWNNQPRKESRFLMSKWFTLLFSGIAWLLFVISILILSSHGFFIDNAVFNFLSDHVLLLVVTAFCFFSFDYWRYRVRARIRFSNSIHLIKNLSKSQKMCEFDIRNSEKDADKEKDFERDFSIQNAILQHKGNWIDSLLNAHSIKSGKAINVGCGGNLHQAVSKPFYDRAFDMIGIDVSEEYLKQYRKLLHAQVVQANAMALPFEPEIFTLVNYTDILEHLIHPFLGLCEANRTLIDNGYIFLTTNNRSAVSFMSFNPLVFMEKLISLYMDRILPPRVIIAEWTGFFFYHTEFSKIELRTLLHEAGFNIVSMRTHFPDKDWVNKLFKRIPGLRFLCSEWLIIGKIDFNAYSGSLQLVARRLL